jgi:periplasmic protein CpxP/Spy
MKKTAALLLATVGLMAMAPIVSAQDAQAPSTGSSDRGMMDRGMMGGDGQKMRGMMDMMGRMEKMMDNCNRMMESKAKGDAPKKE